MGDFIYSSHSTPFSGDMRRSWDFGNTVVGEYHYKMGHGGPYEWYGFWRSPNMRRWDISTVNRQLGISLALQYTIVLFIFFYMAVCQNLVPLVNIKIAGKWMFIPLKMVLIGIDPYPYFECQLIEYQCQYRSNKIPAARKSVAVHSQKQGLSRQVVAVETCKIPTIEWPCSIGRRRVQRNICVYVYMYMSLYLSIYIYIYIIPVSKWLCPKMENVTKKKRGYMG